jgi:hypothetical protein
MITWGQRTNQNIQQVQSLGAIATGDVHMFSRYRTGADGASLHPLQRSGEVPSDSHAMIPRQTAYGPAGMGASRTAPASAHDMTLPPVVPIVGGPNDPHMMVA